jgi:4-hydroxy-tetrahydrodipicolinate reductase
MSQANLRIKVHGATGKLGKLILQEGQGFSESLSRGETPQNCDVVIDVSSAAGTKALLSRLNGEALLVGTTGALPWKELEEYAKTAPVAVVPNFSVGIPLLLELLGKAVQMLPEGWNIEVVEVHHNQKKDAPSGTAKRLVKAIEAEGFSDIPCHALRVGDTFGEHTIWLCGPGERLEFKHVATKREVFAIGAIRWAKWLSKQPYGLIKP